MTLPASGPISLLDIQTEFGGAAPIGTDEYYRGGSYVTSNNTSVPTSGAISFSNFYGGAARAKLNVTYSANTTNASINISGLAGYLTGLTDLTITVNSGVYVYSTSTAGYAINITGGTTGDTITIINNGYIMGMGGIGGGNRAAAGNGGPAINISLNTTITNNGYIGGGGGGGGGYVFCGGGGGAGGGAGRDIPALWSTGGAGGTPGSIGGSLPQGSPYPGAGGAGGGRIFPGTGGTGGWGVYGNGPTGGGAGGGGGGYYDNGGKGGPWGVGAGGGGGWGASGGLINGSDKGGNGGAGSGAGGVGSGTPSTVYSGDVNAPGSGGKAINTNGKTVTWVSGSANCYGVVG